MNHANGTSYEVRITGSFENESTELFLVDSLTNDLIDCVHDGVAFDVEELQSETFTDEVYFETKWKKYIDCRANLPDGVYWVQQGDNLCRDKEMCSVTAKVIYIQLYLFNSNRPNRTLWTRDDKLSLSLYTNVGGSPTRNPHIGLVTVKY